MRCSGTGRSGGPVQDPQTGTRFDLIFPSAAHAIAPHNTPHGTLLLYAAQNRESCVTDRTHSLQNQSHPLRCLLHLSAYSHLVRIQPRTDLTADVESNPGFPGRGIYTTRTLARWRHDVSTVPWDRKTVRTEGIRMKTSALVPLLVRTDAGWLNASKPARKTPYAILTCLLTTLALALWPNASVSAEDLTFRLSLTVQPVVGEEIRVMFQQSLEFLRAELRISLSRPVTVYVYGSQREIFEGLITELEYSEDSARIVAARASFFVVGQRVFINGGASLFSDPPRRVERITLITHELAHIFHNDLMGDSSNAPRWIREGFATRMELRGLDHFGLRSSNGVQEHLNLTWFAYRRGELIPLLDLDTGSRWNAHIQKLGPDRVYAQSFVAVDYLMRTRGVEAMLAYFRAFRTSEDARVNFAAAFGLSLEAFQQQFEEYVSSLSR